MITVTLTFTCNMRASELTEDQIRRLKDAWKVRKDNKVVEVPLGDELNTRIYFQTKTVDVDINESWT